MPAGLEVVTDSGAVQIDADSQPWILVKKGAVSVAAFNRDTNVNATPYIAVGGVCPIIFFGPSAAHTVLLRTENVGGEFRFFLASETGGSVTYFIYDQAPAKNGSYGLQLFSAGGGLTFDALDKHMRIQGVFTATLGGAVTLPIGRTYAASLTYPSRSFYPWYLPQMEFTIESAASVRVAANVVTVSADAIKVIPDAMSNGFANIESFYTSYGYARLVVVDVTDH